MKITNDANPLDRTTAKVITTVYYENFLNLPSLAHPTMMELLKRFTVKPIVRHEEHISVDNVENYGLGN